MSLSRLIGFSTTIRGRSLILWGPPFKVQIIVEAASHARLKVFPHSGSRRRRPESRLCVAPAPKHKQDIKDIQSAYVWWFQVNKLGNYFFNLVGWIQQLWPPGSAEGSIKESLIWAAVRLCGLMCLHSGVCPSDTVIMFSSRGTF